MVLELLNQDPPKRAPAAATAVPAKGRVAIVKRPAPSASIMALCIVRSFDFDLRAGLNAALA
jgi:hypothetical protein